MTAYAMGRVAARLFSCVRSRRSRHSSSETIGNILNGTNESVGDRTEFVRELTSRRGVAMCCAAFLGRLKTRRNLYTDRVTEKVTLRDHDRVVGRIDALE